MEIDNLMLTFTGVGAIVMAVKTSFGGYSRALACRRGHSENSHRENKNKAAHAR
jgi:hypothetical protein